MLIIIYSKLNILRILADAMGLGKTVMTIALILARRGRGTPEDQESIAKSEGDTEYIKKKKKESDLKPFRKVKGSTLIICPMALLGQRKVSPYNIFDSARITKFSEFVCILNRFSYIVLKLHY